MTDDERPVRETQNVTGSFTGTFAEIRSDWEPWGGPVEITLYGPADLPWWKHWFYVAMGRLRGWPYPETAIVGGPISITGIDEDPEGSVTFHYTADGRFKVK